MPTSTAKPMEDRLFDAFREIAFQYTGIRLQDGKHALVASRIAPRLRELGLVDPQEYLALLQDPKREMERTRFIDVISTNHTGFWRDSEHFELLERLVKTWRREGRRQLRIWSAACSSGEEPYSIAATLHAALPGPAQVECKILATDISTRVLRRASEGIYDEADVAALPADKRKILFTRRGDSYVVRPKARQTISFQRINLARPPFPMTGPFDVVFCRNVMIYFDAEVRRGLLDEIYRLLHPEGLLLIGRAETLTGLNTHFVSDTPSVFRPRRREDTKTRRLA